mgnify:CR=1 FL=1
MCLCQGITRFVGHADPNLFETRGGMTKLPFFRQRKTQKYGVLQERYHENDVAFFVFSNACLNKLKFEGF